MSTRLDRPLLTQRLWELHWKAPSTAAFADQARFKARIFYVQLADEWTAQMQSTLPKKILPWFMSLLSIILVGCTTSGIQAPPGIALHVSEDICAIDIVLASGKEMHHEARCRHFERAKIITSTWEGYKFNSAISTLSREELSYRAGYIAKVAGRYMVSANSIAGARPVLVSDSPQQVARYLMEHGAYKFKSMIFDGGYILSLPDGSRMRQGSASMDSWIGQNR